MRNTIDLSLVLACYNEGDTLEKSLKIIASYLERATFSTEVICIDDKSSDSTAKILEHFVYKRKNWRLLLHSENQGRGATVKEGMLQANGQIVGYIDVDLEVSPIYILEFVSRIKKGADVVTATRLYSVSFSNFIRTLSTVIYIQLSRLILKHQLKDTEAGYKFFSIKKILPVLKVCRNKHWFFDTEVLMRSLDFGLKIEQIPVLFLRRQDKKTTVRLIPDTLKYLKTLLEFRKER